MKNHTFGELCRLHARLHAKVVDQIKNHVFLCHRVAILKLETVWKKVSPEKKKNCKKNNRTNLFYCTYWQEVKNWQIRSMKISFLLYRTLCFKINVHQLLHFLILFYFLTTSWIFDSCILYLYCEAFYFMITSSQNSEKLFLKWLLAWLWMTKLSLYLDTRSSERKKSDLANLWFFVASEKHRINKGKKTKYLVLSTS